MSVYVYVCVYVYEQSTNHISLIKQASKSPTAQDVFWPIPGLISCAEVTGDEDCHIMHRMQSGGWPYSKVGRDSLKALSLRAAVHRADVFHLKILCSDRNH